jgi:hypothetical protein
MSKERFVLTAWNLRIMLCISLLLITGAAVSSFLYFQAVLQDYAVVVSHKKADAAASNGNIQALETTKNTLATSQDVIKKAAGLKSSSEFPEFKIVEDVTNYAAKNGLAVTSFDFTTAAANTATTPPATGAAAAAPITSLGGKTVSITVTFASPINYPGLLQFIYDTEQSIPKMQIKGIALNVDTTAGTVTIPPMEIEMYTR